MRTDYFIGGEFDWLRNQLRQTLWHPAPERLARQTETRPSAPVTSGTTSAKQNVLRQTYEPPDDYVQKQNEAKARLSGMSVADYNAWRAGQRNPPPYVHQEYPKMLFRAGGNKTVVNDAKEHLKFSKMGWTDEPKP